MFRIEKPDARFDQAYKLMQETFPPEELVNRAEYEYLLSHPQRDFVFVMLATDDAMIAGSYLALGDGESAAMIEYLAVRVQRKGLGRDMLAAFEKNMLEIATGRSETLCAVVGEVEGDLLPFKFKCGYRLPEKVWYAQPPIEFNSEGQPLHPELPKLLMVKPFPDAESMEAVLLQRIVATIYRRRYVPPMADEVTKARIEAYIFEHVYPRFVESAQQKIMLKVE